MITSFKYFTAAGITGIALVFSLALKPKNGTGAKINTVKADTLYYLQGRRADFEALEFAISNPMDVTPNQALSLRQWIGSRRMIPVIPDSLKKKK